jgi:hypothetical protein
LVVVVTVVGASCSGDDDAAPTTTQTTVTTPATTAAPPTTAPPATDPATTSTLVATTSTDDVDALKAEVAAAFLNTEQLREDLSRAPTLDGLADKLAMIAVPGSPAYAGYDNFVHDLVGKGQRIAPGSPDWSESRVESVELSGDPSDGKAVVTACIVDNQARVGPDGSVVEGSGQLTAGRVKVPMQRMASGWLQTDYVTGVAIAEGVSECPAH